MVLSGTFDNISVISFPEKTRHIASDWQALSYNVLSNTPLH